jgi:hypothetical protein
VGLEVGGVSLALVVMGGVGVRMSWGHCWCQMKKLISYEKRQRKKREKLTYSPGDVVNIS